MSEKDARLLDALVATYNSVGAAETDLMAVRDLYQTLGTSHTFDAAVISKNEEGQPRIHRTYEAGVRQDAVRGFRFGLAAGLVAAAFPAVGIAVALGAGAAGGAAIGAIVGHLQSGIRRDDLWKIADHLEASRSALVVVYDPSMADHVARKITASTHFISKVRDLRAELARG